MPDNEKFTDLQEFEAQTSPARPIMQKALDTYTERRATYGPSEQKFADIALAMFPEGLTLRTREDWVRWGLFQQVISKLARYTKDFHEPHVDSVHDWSVYGFMLEAEDRRVLGLAPFKKVEIGRDPAKDGGVITAVPGSDGQHLRFGSAALGRSVLSDQSTSGLTWCIGGCGAATRDASVNTGGFGTAGWICPECLKKPIYSAGQAFGHHPHERD